MRYEGMIYRPPSEDVVRIVVFFAACLKKNDLGSEK